jgi:hypothetical protein
MKKGILVAVAFVCLVMSPAALADAKRGKVPMTIADNSGHLCPLAAGPYSKNFTDPVTGGKATSWGDLTTKSATSARGH